MKKIFFFIGLISSVYNYAQEIEIELFTTDLSNLVDIQNAGDSRLFVLDRDGLIQILNKEGAINKDPFLDINTKVSDAQDERGLLGLAFHPNYSSNGYFYVNYINNELETIISRFSKSDSNEELADPNSELLLMTIPQPKDNSTHKGGQLVFGSDGLLFMAIGDGGDPEDSGNRAQDLKTYLGKILRIDVDHPENGKNYGIPKDNPYIDDENALDEIWAYGLRNPWKFSIDKTTNEMWVTDVGEAKIEEINKVAATKSGINYGWRCYEGTSPFNLEDCPDASILTFPISEYTHDDSGVDKCSITGGYRYRGEAQTRLYGIYFFADFCSSEIGMLKENDSSWTMSFSKVFTGNSWTTFGEDNNGELYIGDISSGSIYKIKATTLNIDEQNLSQIKLYPNPVHDELTINFGSQINPISEIFVFNIQGQQIKTLITFNENLSKISTKNISKGMYLVEIHNDNGQKTTRKFVKN